MSWCPPSLLLPSHSIRRGARGIRAQSPTMVHIIDTTLSKYKYWKEAENSKPYSGCSERIPYFEASNPVKKGIAADPVIPMAVIQPTQPVSSQPGRMRDACPSNIGNMGPRSTPMKDTCYFVSQHDDGGRVRVRTAKAFSMTEGTNQTVSSSLKSSVSRLISSEMQRCTRWR